MTLSRLALLWNAGALIGLLGLALFGYLSWRELGTDLQQLDRMSELHDQVTRLSTAIHYATLLRREPAVLREIQQDAVTLGGSLDALDDPDARRAAAHLGELAYMMALVGESADPAWDPALASEIRIHDAAIVTALEDLRSRRVGHLIRTLFGVLAVFVIGTLIFGVLCVTGFTWVRHRLRQPLRSIETGIRAIAAGQLEARIALPGNDELGQLAGYVNRMAEQRQGYEIRLRQNEEQFRQLAENITEVFWLSTPDKREMLYISPSYEAIWGRSRNALYQDPAEWLSAIHPDDRPRVSAAVPQQALGTYQEQYRIVRADGQQRWISDRAFPVRNASGEVYRVAGLAEDVTVRVEAELQLRERIKELDCLYQVLELTTGRDWPVERVFGEVVRLLPQSLAHEALAVARIRIGSAEFCSAAWRAPASRCECAIASGMESYGSVEIGYLETLPGGTDPFLPEERTLLCGVAAHLGRMLHNRQLTETLDRSQRLESLGQLTGGIAHDFNNLLTVILGYAELLNEQLADHPAQAGMAGMITSAAQRGADLTHRLLAFARRQTLAPQSIDVNALIATLDPLLRRTLGEHIDIEFVRGGGLWQVLADPAQLESALLNLALNSRDAMPDGGRLTIETANTRLDDDYALAHRELEPGRYVMMAVSDTGTGIAAEHLARVFEPFFSTKEAGKGTGLGMSMVYGFAKQSRGHVNIYSEPGQGTTVKLYLPQSREASATATSPCEPRETHRGTETILLVEDDPRVREYARDQLAVLGYRVIEAGDGPTALDLFKAHSVDLLLTDIVMPGGMSGRQLADAVLRLNPDISVLYSSGYTENAIVHHGRLEPGVQLLTKPYRRADLAGAVRKALRSTA